MKIQYIGRKLPENGGLDKLADLRTELGDEEMVVFLRVGVCV